MLNIAGALTVLAGAFLILLGQQLLAIETILTDTLREYNYTTKVRLHGLISFQLNRGVLGAVLLILTLSFGEDRRVDRKLRCEMWGTKPNPVLV